MEEIPTTFDPPRDLHRFVAVKVLLKNEGMFQLNRYAHDVQASKTFL